MYNHVIVNSTLCPFSQHESASVMMFQHLLESNNLKVEFERCGLSEIDVIFIKEQIEGPRKSEMSSQQSLVSRGLWVLYW